MHRLLLSIIAVVLITVVYAQPYRMTVVVGDSMEPTYSSRDVLLTKRSFDELRRGDVVVFKREGVSYVKRVALIEGDRLTQYYWQDGWDTPPNEVRRAFYEKRGAPKRTMHVPADHVYVVGDNSRESVDSRNFGPVPLSSIESVVPAVDESGLPRFAGTRFAHRLAMFR